MPKILYDKIYRQTIIFIMLGNVISSMFLIQKQLIKIFISLLPFKCSLPLVKLQALMTMHNEGSVSSQSFSLPLINSLDVSQNEKSPPKYGGGGSLNLFISYKKEACHTLDQRNNRNPGEMIGLSISILRMCSLKVCCLFSIEINSIC